MADKDLRSDSEDESLSPIFGFSFDDEGNAKSQWEIDPQLSPLKSKEVLTYKDFSVSSTVEVKDFPGFSTAAGKAIKVSEKALQEAKSKFDMDLSTCSNNVPAVDNAKKIYDWDADENRDSTSQPAASHRKSSNLKETGFVGFSTAAGKAIKVSEKALQEAKSKFDMDLSTCSNNVPAADNAKKTYDWDADENRDSSSQPVASHRKSSNLKETGFVGFSTAAGKAIKVSEQALQEAKSKFDMDLSTCSNNVPAADNAKKIYDWDADENRDSTSQPVASHKKSNNLKETGFVGFSTAAGKAIKVSEKALQEAKSKFDMDLSTCSNNVPAADNAKKTYDWDADENRDSSSKPVASHRKSSNLKETGLAGFSTAAGKAIKVSEKAIEEARSKFDMDLSTCSNNMPDAETAVTDVEKPLSVSCTSNVFDFGQTSSLSPEESTEIDDLTRSLLEDISTNDESIWENGCLDTSETVSISLATVQSKGEIIPVLKLVVVRVYPILYCVKSASSFRYVSEKAHLQRERLNENKQEELRHKLLPDIEEKVRNSFFSKNFLKLDIRKLEEINVDDLVAHLNSLEDGSASDILERLSQTKKKEVEESRVAFEEKVRAAVEEEFTKQLQGLELQSRASPVLKLRVVDVGSYLMENIKSINGIVSIWNPNEDILKAVKENKIFEFHSLKPSTFQPYQEVRLSTTKGTRIHPAETPLLPTFFARKFSPIDEVLSTNFSPPFEEFDTIGVIAKISPYTTSSGQMIHLSDSKNNILKVKFWNSLQDAGLEELIKVGTIVICTDLQWRISSAKIGIAFAQDVSSFQINTKMDHLLKEYRDAYAALTSIVAKLTDVKKEDLSLSHVQKANQVTDFDKEIDPVVAMRKTRAAIKRRYLEQYDEPPELPPLYSPAKRGRVSKKFIPPRRADTKPN